MAKHSRTESTVRDPVPPWKLVWRQGTAGDSIITSGDLRDHHMDQVQPAIVASHRGNMPMPSRLHLQCTVGGMRPDGSGGPSIPCRDNVSKGRNSGMGSTAAMRVGHADSLPSHTAVMALKVQRSISYRGVYELKTPGGNAVVIEQQTDYLSGRSRSA